MASHFQSRLSVTNRHLSWKPRMRRHLLCLVLSSSIYGVETYLVLSTWLVRRKFLQPPFFSAPNIMSCPLSPKSQKFTAEGFSLWKPVISHGRPTLFRLWLYPTMRRDLYSALESRYAAYPWPKYSRLRTSWPSSWVLRYSEGPRAEGVRYDRRRPAFEQRMRLWLWLS